MRYTSDQAVREVLRRSARISKKRERRVGTVLSCAAAALFCALLAVTALLSGGSPAPAGTVYGSSILSPSAGGYVLIGVLAFALGVVVTLLCVRWREKRLAQSREETSEQECKRLPQQNDEKTGHLITNEEGFCRNEQ